MKKIITAAAIASASLFAQQSTQAAALLLAPGFEAPAAPDASAGDSNLPVAPNAGNPWYGDATRANQQAYSSSVGTFNGAAPARNRIAGPVGNASPQSAFEGTQYGYAYSVGGTFGYLAQNVTGAGIVAGHSYTGSAYFMNKAATATDGDRLQGGSNDTVRLLFLDSGGIQIGSTAISPTSVSSTSTQNVWTPINVTATAPAGTATIEFQAYLQRGTAGGVMFVDAANLVDSTVAPEPVSCLVLSAGTVLLAGRRRR